VATLPETAGRLAYASEVEKGAIAALRKYKPGRRLDTNVEYYTALLLEALEIPREAFTACSRSAAPPAGARTVSSRKRAAASSARSPTMSALAPARDATGRALSSLRRARGARRSPLYEALASASRRRDILRFLLTLPKAKRQPNLLLGGGAPSSTARRLDAADFRRRLLANERAVRDAHAARSTQTNEPADAPCCCPVLAALAAATGLIEVGASAGLCSVARQLRLRLRPRPHRAADAAGACFSLQRQSAHAACPLRCREIVWRAGLDLKPSHVADPQQGNGSRTLVWPEQTARLATAAAGDGGRETVRPRVVPGRPRHDLATLAAEAPAEATLVDFPYSGARLRRLAR
jgi:hypothetical protein